MLFRELEQPHHDFVDVVELHGIASEDLRSECFGIVSRRLEREPSRTAASTKSCRPVGERNQAQ